MVLNDENENTWQGRCTYVMVLLSQIMGLPMFVGLAATASTAGPTGFILSYIVCCLFVGIPLLYMEFIISQFTARDCIDVWKVRRCVSHIGYILVIGQLIQIIYNHVLNTFIFHYLLISFENPVPYYTCGRWSTKNCNILRVNFTVNNDCIRLEDPPSYCYQLHTTFPEYQYWRFKIMGQKSNSFYIAWQVCLASALICVVMFLCIVKRKRSVQWAVKFFTVFPILGYVLLLMCSMTQKGVVVKYDEALDSDFSDFIEQFQLSQLVLHMVHTLGIGSGVAFNLGCSSSFRAPAYANTVVTVVLIVATSTVAICVTAMMSCPYAYEYGIDPQFVLNAPISMMYEKTPRFLFEYRTRYFYLILTYSCHTLLGTGTNVMFILHMVDMAVARSAMVAKYPGLTSLLGVLGVFVLSIPMMSSAGFKILLKLKQILCVLAVFVAILEIAVFVIWYGVEKFSEDVHFMQGLRPKSYMKICWVLSILLLSYTFCVEAYDIIATDERNTADNITWYLFIALIGLAVIIFGLKLLVAACRKKINDVVHLDPSWGPKSEVLQRSRAMFSAHAMTKEYLYRQYHLQAGILARQRVSNCRPPEQKI